MKQKIALFILSMSLFFVIVGLLCMDIPISFQKGSEFIGFHELWLNTRVGLFIIGASVLMEFGVYSYLKNQWNHTAKELSVEVIEVEELNYDTLTFIASFMLPLVSFQFHQLSHWMVLVMLVVILGVIFCNSKGYYTNPTLALLGFKLYKLKIKTQQIANNNHHIVVISKEKLEAHSKFRYVKITDEVGYVI